MNDYETESSGNKPEEAAWYSVRIGSDPIFSPMTIFFDSVDVKNKILVIIYWIIVVGAYFVTQIYRIATDDYVCEMFATPGAGFNTIDLFSCALTVAIFIGFDFWKSGFSIYTFIYIIVLSSLVNLAVSLPFYLSLKISTKCKQNNPNYQYITFDDLKKNTCQLILMLINPILCILMVVWYLIKITPFSTDVNTCNSD